MIADKRSLRLLRDILARTVETTEGIDARRYRVEHPHDLPLLDELVNRNLLRRHHEYNTYRVAAVCLVLIDDAKSNALLADIELIYSYLRQHYQRNLDKPILLTDVATRIDLPHDRVIECIAYMADAHCLGGYTTDLSEKGAVCYPSEDFIKHEHFRDFIQQRIEWWYSGTSTTKPSDEKVHGNAKRFSSEREKVLGAGLALLAKYPDKVKKKKNGSVSWEALQAAVEDKGPLFATCKKSINGSQVSPCR